MMAFPIPFLDLDNPRDNSPVRNVGQSAIVAGYAQTAGWNAGIKPEFSLMESTHQDLLLRINVRVGQLRVPEEHRPDRGVL